MSHQNVSMLNGRFSELFSYFNNLWHLNTYVDYTLSRLTDHLKLGDVNENTTNCIMLLDVQLYWTKWKQDQHTLRPYLQHYKYLLHQLISFTVKVGWLTVDCTVTLSKLCLQYDLAEWVGWLTVDCTVTLSKLCLQYDLAEWVGWLTVDCTVTLSKLCLQYDLAEWVGWLTVDCTVTLSKLCLQYDVAE